MPPDALPGDSLPHCQASREQHPQGGEPLENAAPSRTGKGDNTLTRHVRREVQKPMSGPAPAPRI
ncbi:hypothetical protein [Verrucomicrobium spinosum]|uniref:hypothetical protein n=1 Tax=Verrucomicrobium spinosum TaxID=2736 RepID=UPI000B17C147|nr:hypothetical protein [Verrucomicrobium spinosum]